MDKSTREAILREVKAAQDIVDLAKTIGTEEFSAVIPEYCGVISVKPTTRAKRHRVVHEEERFDFAVLQQAIEARVALDIRTMQAGNEKDVVDAGELESVSAIAPDKLVIVDIRHPDDEERKPLADVPYRVEKVPFFRLNTRFTRLPPDSHYLLYCDKGVMSRLHATHLRERGHANVGIYKK